MKQYIFIIFTLCLTLLFTGCKNTMSNDTLLITADSSIDSEINELRVLTENEIEMVNSAFRPFITLKNNNDQCMINPILFLLTSYYENPKDMDFKKFLMCFETEEMLNQKQVSKDEFLKLKATNNFENYFDKTQTLDAMPLPINRKPVSEIDRFLTNYMGITSKDLNTENALYVGEPYNAFYNFTSDVSYPQFNCTSGETNGIIITLYTDKTVLTLHKIDNKYYIYSYLERN